MARQIIDAVFRDGTLQQASGRWRAGQPDPEQFVPGDIPAIRAMAADAIVRGLGAVSLQRATRLHLKATPTGRFDLYRAVTYLGSEEHRCQIVRLGVPAQQRFLTSTNPRRSVTFARRRLSSGDP
jgi:hypothetical protein